jgi:hypothetical protein
MVPDQPLGGRTEALPEGYSPAARIGTLDVANFAEAWKKSSLSNSSLPVNWVGVRARVMKSSRD